MIGQPLHMRVTMCGQMVAGRPPFRGSHDYGTFQKVLAGDYSFPDCFPPLPADLVAKLLVWKDPWLY
jgi:hypothetical protein